MSRANPLLQCLLLLYCTSGLADYQAGLDAYNAGDYATAMAQWKAAVKTEPEREDLAVYRESLYAIGMLYWQGEGVEQDYGVAAVWLRQAADINHPGAQAKLGYLHITGEGVTRNYAEAEKWLRMAAEQGDPDAQHNLDILEQEGLIPASGPVVSAPAGERWIMQQDPERYTIQVIALSALDKLLAFIDNHPDWSPFAIYRQTRYDQPLWVMVQGDYPDVESAREAVQSFPAGFQDRDSLWIRKFGRVQRLLE